MSDRTPEEIVGHALRQMGLEADHAFALKEIPAYAQVMEDFLQRQYKAPAPEQRTNRQSTERLVRNLNDRLMQPDLPWPEEEMPHRPVDELLDLLEERLQKLGFGDFLFYDDDGVEVTLRGAFHAGSLRLWERTATIIQDFANAKRRQADKANACVKLAEEIFKRARNEGWSD